MNRRRGLLVVLIVVLALAGTIQAQGNETRRILDDVDIPVRDALELAERLSGVSGAASIVPTPAPAYKPGDRQSFFVGNNDDDNIFSVEAELAAATPGVYLWVEVGVPYDADLLNRIAYFLDELLFPAVRERFGQEPSPGIDGDPHIYVLNATGLGDTIGGYFNDGSVYPREVIETSNEHEMFVIAVDNVPFDSSAYLYVLAHEFVHMIQHNEDVNEETWVIEGTAELGAFLTIEPRIFAIQRYLMNPTIQLNSWDIDAAGPYYGAASLFFTYLVERAGPEIILAHSREPADGIAGIDNALRTIGATDSSTGQPLTFADVFADWLAANLLNDRTFSDGRFGYESLDLGDSRAAITASYGTYPLVLTDRTVNQHGGQYLLLRSDIPRTLTVTFEGSESVPVVPTEPHSGSFFYWANRSDQSDVRLTRAFDLSGVESAALHFWAWYEMEPFWDYGYISVSADGGETWQVLETAYTTTENPNSRAFAAGITGFSGGGVEARPAPFMGVSYDFERGVVTDVLADTGAAAAGILPGDQLTAIDHQPFPPVELVERLNQYAVGDTVLLTVVRDGREIDLPVTLGAHPDRTLPPTATWIEEVADLTPFVGGEVLVRFEYVTDQAFTRNGWVLDDIGVPEIGYFDDAESDSGGWLAEGWVRIENVLPQDFLVEVVQAGAPPTVTRWLMPGEGTQGSWTLEIGPDSPAALIISGMTPYTTQPAMYDLTVAAAE